MRKFFVIAIVVAVVGGAAAYMGVFSRGGEAASGPQAGGPGGMGGRPQGGGDVHQRRVQRVAQPPALQKTFECFHGSLPF